MKKTIEELNEMTRQQLTDLYNELTGPGIKDVKIFKTHGLAVNRVTFLLRNSDEDELADSSEVVQNSTPDEDQGKSTSASEDKEQPATPNTEGQTMAKKKAPVGRRAKFADEDTIHVDKEFGGENPKREGTPAHKCFDIYLKNGGNTKKGCKVGTFFQKVRAARLDEKYARRILNWDVTHENVSIKAA